MTFQDEYQAFYFAGILIIILTLKIARTLLSIISRSFF
jgi:hypothetical protein